MAGPAPLLRSAPIQMTEMIGQAPMAMMDMRSGLLPTGEMRLMGGLETTGLLAGDMRLIGGLGTGLIAGDMRLAGGSVVAAPMMTEMVAQAPAVMAIPEPIQYTVAAPQPVVQMVHQPAPVMVKAPVVEQRVHYENRPVVAGYNTEIMKPNLGMGLITPGMDNLVTKSRVLAPARTHTELTEQITVQHPTRVNVEKIAVEVPVAQHYAHPVPVPVTPQVDVHHHTVPVVQQYAAVAAAPVAVQAAPMALAATPIVGHQMVGHQMIGGVEELRSGLIGGVHDMRLMGGIETGLIGGVRDMRLMGGIETGLIGGVQDLRLMNGLSTGLVGGIQDIRSGLIGHHGINSGVIVH